MSAPTARIGLDVLSEETRKQRRNLDIVAVLGILVVVLNLVPNRISAVGVDFGPTKKQSFLIVLLILDAWFVTVFSVYALADLIHSRRVFEATEEELRSIDEQEGPRREYIDERLRSAERATPAERGDLISQIDAQATRIANNRSRARTLAMLRSLGRMRVLVDVAVPIGLGIAAAVLLIVKLV